jgi:hypothetical protein
VADESALPLAPYPPPTPSGGRTTFWVLSGCALHPILTHHSAAAPTPGLLPSPTVTAAALSAALGPNAPAQPLPFQDELNALCLSALAATGAAAYARLLAHVRESGVGGGRGSAGAGMASEPWSLFCVGLWLWLGIEPRGGAPLAPASPWERVLCRCGLIMLHLPYLTCVPSKPCYLSSFRCSFRGREREGNLVAPSRLLPSLHRRIVPLFTIRPSRTAIRICHPEPA